MSAYLNSIALKFKFYIPEHFFFHIENRNTRIISQYFFVTQWKCTTFALKIYDGSISCICNLKIISWHWEEFFPKMQLNIMWQTKSRFCCANWLWLWVYWQFGGWLIGSHYFYPIEILCLKYFENLTYIIENQVYNN